MCFGLSKVYGVSLDLWKQLGWCDSELPGGCACKDPLARVIFLRGRIPSCGIFLCIYDPSLVQIQVFMEETPVGCSIVSWIMWTAHLWSPSIIFCYSTGRFIYESWTRICCKEASLRSKHSKECIYWNMLTRPTSSLSMDIVTCLSLGMP